LVLVSSARAVPTNASASAAVSPMMIRFMRVLLGSTVLQAGHRSPGGKAVASPRVNARGPTLQVPEAAARPRLGERSLGMRQSRAGNRVEGPTPLAKERRGGAHPPRRVTATPSRT